MQSFEPRRILDLMEAQARILDSNAAFDPAVYSELLTARQDGKLKEPYLLRARSPQCIWLCSLAGSPGAPAHLERRTSLSAAKNHVVWPQIAVMLSREERRLKRRGTRS